VSAKDKNTGKEQNIRIEASSGLSQEEIDRMKQEAEANADADKKAKEEIDKLNAADSMVFQVEKQMKEIEGKLPEDKQGPIDAALAELKAAHAAKDVAGCDAAQEKLNGALQAASAEIQAAMQQNQGGGDQGPTDGGGDAGGADDVTDVDFEEVK
ncbi:MAG: Hsp70 family protein, partial [Schleiferiaceae bacterium]